MAQLFFLGVAGCGRKADYKLRVNSLDHIYEPHDTVFHVLFVMLGTEQLLNAAYEGGEQLTHLVVVVGNIGVSGRF